MISQSNAPIDNTTREGVDGLDQRIDDVESQLKAGTLDFQFATDGTKYGYLDDNGDFVPLKTPLVLKA